MTLAISSAIPNNLIRYSNAGLRINDELTLAAKRLAETLSYFEATCRERGYALNVSHFAIELQNYAKQADNVDRWVYQVGMSFFWADSAKWIIKATDIAVSMILVPSTRRSGRYLYFNFSWVKIFGLKPRGIRALFDILATRIMTKNFTKYFDKVARKNIIFIFIAIGLEWIANFGKYGGTQPISALSADTIFIIISFAITDHITKLFLVALVKTAISGILIAALCVATLIILDLLLDWIWEKFLQDWTINMFDNAIKWTMTGLNRLPELGAKTVQILDEKIFKPITRTISSAFDNFTKFFDSASERLQKQIKGESSKKQNVYENPNNQRSISISSSSEHPPKLNDNVENVIKELKVESNERYQPREGKTYCNIYVLDATRRLGIKLFGEAAKQSSPEAVDWDNDGIIDDYMDANETIAWLRGTYTVKGKSIGNQGPDNGWEKVNSKEAAELASKGYFVLVGWYNSNGIGHIAIVRPNSTPENIRIAQAGLKNFSDGPINAPSWPLDELEYFVYRKRDLQNTNL